MTLLIVVHALVTVICRSCSFRQHTVEPGPLVRVQRAPTAVPPVATRHWQVVWATVSPRPFGSLQPRSLVPSRHDTRASNFDMTSHRLLLRSRGRHQRDNGSADDLDGHRSGGASGGVQFRTNAGSLPTTRSCSLTVVVKHGARQAFVAWA